MESQGKSGKFLNFLAYNIDRGAQDQSLVYFLWQQTGEFESVTILYILSIKCLLSYLQLKNL